MVENQEQFEANVDNFVAELKSHIDAQSTENISKFEDWFAQKYDNVVDITEATFEEVHGLDVEEVEPEMILYAAKSAAAAESDNSAYVGYGILSMGVVLATSATYLYKKRQGKQVAIDNPSLIKNEGFERI